MGSGDESVCIAVHILDATITVMGAAHVQVYLEICERL